MGLVSHVIVPLRLIRRWNLRQLRLAQPGILEKKK